MAKSYQQQYAEILKRLINEPEKVDESRVGNVSSRFVENIRVDLTKEFPIMDVKKVSFKNILVELLWFIKGDTNIKYLVENKCNIWNDDAYRYFKEKYEKYLVNENTGMQLTLPFEINKEDFIKNVLEGKKIKISDEKEYTYGDLDRVYGFQWRKFNGKTDQLQNCINTLKTNPNDRRMIVTAHNPTDLRDGNVGLPSCHNYFQFYTTPLTLDERKKYCVDKLGLTMSDQDNPEEYLDSYNIPKRYVSLYYNIRSNDFFLGQPYNTPSYALLLMMVGKIVNMIPKEVVCNAVDCHLYEAHVEAAHEWLERYKDMYNGSDEREKFFTFSNAKVKIKNRDYKSIDDFNYNDFELINYTPSESIKAPLLT